MTGLTAPKTLLVTVLGIGMIAGAGLTYLALRSQPASSTAAVATPSKSPSTATRMPGGSVTLSADDLERAQISVTAVEAATLSESMAIPALVAADAYKQTVVTSLVAGRVTRVLAELGQHVQRGQVLAQIYSPELAEAQRAYISVSAALQAHEQQLARVDSLVAIGSASRQELEMAHAEHAALTTSIEGARTRLELIGLSAEQVASLSSASQIAAATDVRAPLDGVVTTRQANVGANVDGTIPLFTIVDLSSVWVEGELYEHDVPSVGVGRPATVTFSALPDLTLRGAISYIDPQLSRDTRTARVRVEIPNGHEQLRLGMYAQMRIDTAGGRVEPVIPKTAVQIVGDHAVVYVADRDTPGRFVERSIRTGREAGDRIAIESGLAVGESVVSAGSFYLRAERERLGQTGESSAPTTSTGQVTTEGRQTARVRVTEKGFEPARITLKSGVPALITFVRTTDATCAKEVVFPSLNVRRELPLNEAVIIELTPARADLGFVCGMGMFKGSIAWE